MLTQVSALGQSLLSLALGHAFLLVPQNCGHTIGQGFPSLPGKAAKKLFRRIFERSIDIQQDLSLMLAKKRIKRQQKN